MKRDEVGHIEVRNRDLKIDITGRQENSFGSQDLLLRAALALLNFDFKFMQENDPRISDKYFITLLDRLGSLAKNEAGVGREVNNLTFLKSYIDWLTDKDVRNDPELVSFLNEYQTLEED